MGAIGILAKSVGLEVRQARKRAGLNQTSLANKIGVTQTTITHWERGLHVPSVESLYLIAELCDTSFGQLTASLHNEAPATIVAEVVQPRGANMPTVRPIKRPRAATLRVTFGVPVQVVHVKAVSPFGHEVRVGDYLAYSKTAAAPRDHCGLDKQHCLIEWVDGDLSLGKLEEHPAKEGVYRTLNLSAAYASDWEVVRNVYPFIAQIDSQLNNYVLIENSACM